IRQDRADRRPGFFEKLNETWVRLGVKGYADGLLTNILVSKRGNDPVRGWDFSNLVRGQAYLSQGLNGFGAACDRACLAESGNDFLSQPRTLGECEQP